MRFWLVLLILGWRMRWLAKHNDAFREKIAGKRVDLQFRTVNGKVARFYRFDDERVSAHGGINPQATMCMSFRDAVYAYETIMKAAKDKTVFMQGVGNKDIVITGDAQEMMWFMSLMKYLPPRKKKPTSRA